MPAALNSSPPPPAAPVLQVHDGTYTPADQFLKDPDSLCSTVTWKDEEDRVIWVYRIQVCVPAAVAVMLHECAEQAQREAEAFGKGGGAANTPGTCTAGTTSMKGTV